jgi:hypothetical protein
MKASFAYIGLVIGLVISGSTATTSAPAQTEESRVKVKGGVVHVRASSKNREGTYARSCAAHGGGFPFFTDSQGAVTFDVPGGSGSGSTATASK